MSTVTDVLTSIKVGPVVQGRLLQMYPLVSNDIVEPAYDLAGAAFAAGTLTVIEVSQAGAVPTLRVTNSGARPVLLLDGEELIGAKQNRVPEPDDSCSAASLQHDSSVLRRIRTLATRFKALPFRAARTVCRRPGGEDAPRHKLLARIW